MQRCRAELDSFSAATHTRPRCAWPCRQPGGVLWESNVSSLAVSGIVEFNDFPHSARATEARRRTNMKIETKPLGILEGALSHPTLLWGLLRGATCAVRVYDKKAAVVGLMPVSCFPFFFMMQCPCVCSHVFCSMLYVCMNYLHVYACRCNGRD
jgi:hypothetical protein